MAHKILFIAPLPPPVHGSAMVSQYIKESRVVNEAFDCDFVNLSTSRSMEEIGKGGIKKLFRFVAAYFEVLWKLITHRYSLCYLAITCHGMGFLKDAPFVLLCKLFCRKVVLHQHNKGLSRDVARWPYRWLMPLVYRNTTVMLLSWHLYEDISSVVKREQVVVCANGIPEPHPNPLQKRGDSGHPGCSQISHTEFTEDTEISCNAENICQRADANSQNARIASLACGHPDETLNLTQTTQNTQTNISLQDDQRDEHANIDTNSQNARIASLACGLPDEGFGLTQNSQNTQNGKTLRPCTSGVLSNYAHTEITESTEGTTLRPCGLRGETSNLTQTSQKTQNIISEQGCQRELDTNSQNLQVASPLLASGVGRHREAQFSSSLSSSLEPSVPRLLFLSNLIESKGIYVLLEACRMLKEEGIAFQCDYVGGESKLISGEAFRSAIAERGLTDCVTYHGPQYGAAKDRFFREADIFVQPTFDDCFPLTLVEAMQYRLPIVSTDVGAIPDIVTDGVNGFVCAQRDVQALAEALRKLIAEPQMRVAMGQRGYELYRERMTLEVFEGNFTEILKSLVFRV